MKLLLDTHIILWYLNNDAKLSVKAKGWIDKEDNEIFNSIVSLWEVAIKHIISPDRMVTTEEILSEYAENTGFNLLPLKLQHVILLKTLHRQNDAKKHNDPFDRMLICQAKAENMMFLTHDSLIPGYDGPCVVYV